jgi:hypothetical protein
MEVQTWLMHQSHPLRGPPPERWCGGGTLHAEAGGVSGKSGADVGVKLVGHAASVTYFFTAVGSARQVPVVENGEIKIGWPLCVKATISVGHRLSDGAEAARFMQKLAEFLENPVRMLV